MVLQRWSFTATRPPYSLPIDPLLDRNGSLRDLVEAVRSLEYGRPSAPGVVGMLREQRGTCTVKHRFLAAAMQRRFPDAEPQIVHRVYRLSREQAGELFGAEVTATVPEGGLVDVHRYLTAIVDGRRIEIDATFPGEPWDGHSPMSLACGPGEDHPAGADPDDEKRQLEAEHCDPAVRQPFIEALSG
jgi:hypothetical protein